MKRPHVKTKISKGFTLIELVMVIVILGVLAAVALPKFIDLSSEARLSKVQATRAVMESLLGGPLRPDLVVAEKVGTCEGSATMATCLMTDNDGVWATGLYCAR